MKAFICLFALVATASAAHLGLPISEVLKSNPLVGNRIVGGSPTDISQVPYQISLQVDDFHICGGSILNERFVLTASHCIVGNEANWPYMNVRVGSSSNSNGGQFIKVAKLHSHPKYNPDAYWTNDIAILELSTPITLSSNAKPVGLPTLGDPLPVNQYATASGWGRLTEGGISPTQLQSVQIPIQEPSVCEFAYGSGFNRNTMVCAASLAGGQSTCQGDSGGPLVHNGVQYGIVSWAQGCARPEYPTVFAHVSNLRGFINDIVGI